MNSTPKLAHFKLEAKDADPHNMKIEMDDKPLRGCQEIILRAGISGFTNVCVQMDAPISVDVVAAYFATVDFQEHPIVVSAVRTAIQEAVEDLPNDYEERDTLARLFATMDTESQLRFTSKLLSTLRTEIGL